MEVSLASMEVIRAMAEIVVPESESDAGVGAACARTPVIGAGLNVRINAATLTDEAVAAEYAARAGEIHARAMIEEAAILELVDGRI